MGADLRLHVCAGCGDRVAGYELNAEAVAAVKAGAARRAIEDPHPRLPLSL
jgi:hypothetical protein